MKSAAVRFCVALLVLSLALGCGNATSEPTTPTPSGHTQAQVVRVIDGDTIEVSVAGQTHKVRYIGIDTPETKHPTKPVEPFGPEAAAKNEELVGGKIVGLEEDISETDRYGRLLRYVYVGGTFETVGGVSATGIAKWDGNEW